MDPTFITPFVTSSQNVFSTMLQIQLNINEPRVKQSNEPRHDVSGIIGMSGDVVGSVVLSFPNETAESVVSLFCGEDVTSESPDFADAIGELVNMICGGAKAMFPGKSVSISCPSVVMGHSHTIASQSDTPCVVIPCSTDCGDFVIEVAIRPTEPANVGSASGAARAS